MKNVGIGLLFSAVLNASLPAFALAQDETPPGREESPSKPDEAPKPAEREGLLPIPEFGGSVWERPYLTGDWNGARTALAGDAGVQVDFQYAQYFQGITSGGRDTSNGEYGGTLSSRVRLDLMRMGILPGALVDIRGLSRYGNFVSTDSGQLLPVNTNAIVPQTAPLYDDYGLAITNLTYTQFLADYFAVFAGKIDTFDGDQNEFATGRGATQFMNFNFVFAAPAALVPGSTLGTGILLLPKKWLTISSAVLNANNTTSTIGFDDIDGGISVTEARLQHRLGALPGGVNASYIYFFSTDFRDLDSKLSFKAGEGLSLDTKDSSWMTILSGWQYLYTEEAPGERPLDLADGRPDLQGIGLFGRVAFADKDTNPFKFSFSVGAGARGLIPTRDNDVLGVGYFYSDIDPDRFFFGDKLDNNSQGMEAFYSIAITRAARLTLDVQLIDSPLPRADDAVVLGTRLVIDL